MLALLFSFLFVESEGHSRYSKIASIILAPFSFIWGIIKVLGLTVTGVAKVCWPARWFFKFSLEDKVVLVTGGANGLGAALVRHLASQDARVVIWDIDRQGMREIVHAIKTEGHDVTAYYCDVSSFAEVNSTADLVSDEIGEVDIVINNAGMANVQNLVDLTQEQIKRCLGVNLMSQFWVTKSFLPQMIARNSGFIVSVASTAGVVGTSLLSDYSASKFGTVGFIEALTIELEQMNVTGVRTMIVCPYFIHTRMFQGVRTR